MTPRRTPPTGRRAAAVQPRLPLPLDGPLPRDLPASTAGGPRRPEAPDTPLRRSVPRGTAPRPADGTAGRHDTDPAGHAPERGADDWRLDEHTRDVGRRGLAAARAILDRGVRAA